MKITELSRQSETDPVTEPTAKVVRVAVTAVPESRLGADTSAHKLALTELRRLLNAWRRHEPLARLGQEPEELHQLRVTVRRIDATLALFKHQLPEALVRARRTAKGVLRALGAARDVDVQLAELSRYCADLPDEERAAAEPLRRQLEVLGARAHTRMVRLLDSAPTRRWLEELTVGTEAADAVPARATHSALAVMPARVRQRFRKLRKTVRSLPANASMEEFHDVRRRAKQLRYAIESGAGMFGKPAEDLLKALRRMQERLGAHQDAHMARSRLATLAADSANALPPATLFLMGRLAERQSNLISQADKTLSRSWRRVRGKRWKTLRARLGELSARAAATRRGRSAASRAVVALTAGPAAVQLATPGSPVAETSVGPGPERSGEPPPRALKH
jgi:CHAD domain-containing protein